MVYDNGGHLKPGDTIITNEAGEPEWVLRGEHGPELPNPWPRLDPPEEQDPRGVR